MSVFHLRRGRSGRHDSPMEQTEVLVLCDDERVRGAALALAKGQKVAFFPNRLALLGAISGAPCVAVIDLRAEGFAAARDLRDATAAPLGIVMLCERDQDSWLCKQAGADIVLHLPLEDPRTLAEAVAELLSKIASS